MISAQEEIIVLRSDQQRRETSMKMQQTVVLAGIIGFGFGAISTGVLHAQAKPPIYVVAEIDIKNADAYMKDYAPKAQAVIKASGGRILAAGKAVSIEGAPPKSRVVVQEWDSMEKYQAYRNSKEFKEVRKTGEPLATFRSFVVESVQR